MGSELIERMKVLHFLKLVCVHDLALHSPSGHYQEATTLITTTAPPTSVRFDGRPNLIPWCFLVPHSRVWCANEQEHQTAHGTHPSR